MPAMGRWNRMRRVAPERALSAGELEGIAGLDWLERRLGVEMPRPGQGTGAPLDADELARARAETVAQKSQRRG